MLTDENVGAVADGRVYTGAAAIANGLVDEVGYLDDAVDSLAAKLGVDDPAELRVGVLERGSGGLLGLLGVAAPATRWPRPRWISAPTAASPPTASAACWTPSAASGWPTPAASAEESADRGRNGTPSATVRGGLPAAWEPGGAAGGGRRDGGSRAAHVASSRTGVDPGRLFG